MFYREFVLARLLGIVFLVITIFLCSFDAGVTQQVTEKDTSELVVSATKLSRQTTRPFENGGGIVDEVSPQWSRYKDSILRFPSAESCLFPEAATADLWSLVKVDWAKMLNNRDIEVCLFRLIDSIGDPKDIRVFLTQLGYTGSDFISESERCKSRTLASPLMDESYVCLRLEGYLAANIFDSRVNFNHTVYDRILRLSDRNRDHFLNLGFSKSGMLIFVFSGRRGS